MNKKDSCWTEMRFGKKDMDLVDIIQGLEACATVSCDRCPLDGPVEGWDPEDVPDCGTVLLNAAAKELRRHVRKKKVWRWDDIFRVYRCPTCGRPEKPCLELWKKGGVKRMLPSRCTYCLEELDGVEGEENDH